MMVEVTIVRALEVILSRLKMDGETARIMREHLVSERLAAQREKPVFPAGIEPVDPPASARTLGTWIKCACGVERDTACYCATEGCEYGKGEGSQ